MPCKSIFQADLPFPFQSFAPKGFLHPAIVHAINSINPEYSVSLRFIHTYPPHQYNLCAHQTIRLEKISTHAPLPPSRPSHKPHRPGEAIAHPGSRSRPESPSNRRQRDKMGETTGFRGLSSSSSTQATAHMPSSPPPGSFPECSHHDPWIFVSVAASRISALDLTWTPLLSHRTCGITD